MVILVEMDLIIPMYWICTLQKMGTQIMFEYLLKANLMVRSLVQLGDTLFLKSILL